METVIAVLTTTIQYTDLNETLRTVKAGETVLIEPDGFALIGEDRVEITRAQYTIVN